MGPYHPILQLNDSGLAAVIRLLRAADVAFGNKEGSIFDAPGFAGSPAAENGGNLRCPQRCPHKSCEPWVSQWCPKPTAMRPTGDRWDCWLRTGAWMPPRLRTPAVVTAWPPPVRRSVSTLRSARVALVATASTFTPMSAAGPSVDYFGQPTHPRTGISALHAQHIRLIPPSSRRGLREISRRVNPYEASPDRKQVRKPEIVR